MLLLFKEQVYNALHLATSNLTLQKLADCQSATSCLRFAFATFTAQVPVKFIRKEFQLISSYRSKNEWIVTTKTLIVTTSFSNVNRTENYMYKWSMS